MLYFVRILLLSIIFGIDVVFLHAYSIQMLKVILLVVPVVTALLLVALWALVSAGGTHSQHATYYCCGK
jgi:NADH:ubiquinone oxidoreductase subunit 3 (subunit A)